MTNILEGEAGPIARRRKKRKASSRPGVKVGANQFSLLRAMLYAPGHRFRSLRKWYTTFGVTGGSRESRRQSCWGTIRAGWVTAQRVSGRWECRLTPEGKKIATAQTKISFIIHSHKKEPPAPRKPAKMVPLALRVLMSRCGTDLYDMYSRRN